MTEPEVTEPEVTAFFVPDAMYEAGEPQEKTIADPARVGAPDREFFVALREPIGAPTPWPVIVLSHGGSTGKKNPATAMERWAEFAARLGYLSVAIAHPLRSNAEGQALCEHLEATADQCNAFKYNNYDRPRDFSRLVDELELLSATPAWTGKMDLGRLAYLGHSAGAGSTQMINGACRSYYSAHVGDELFCAKDDRPPL